jgi:hypothetical protein
MDERGEDPSRPIGESRLPALRVVVVILGFFFGGLFALGSYLAALFEVEGFGTPEGPPRGWYLALLGAAFAVSVAGPFVSARVLLPGWTKLATWGGVVAVVVALLLFGVTLSD